MVINNIEGNMKYIITARMSATMFFCTDRDKFSEDIRKAVLHDDYETAAAHRDELKIALHRWMSTPTMAAIPLDFETDIYQEWKKANGIL